MSALAIRSLRNVRHAVFLASFVARCVYAQQLATHNLSGRWELHFDSKNVPLASLTTPVTEEEKAEQIRKNTYEIRWCHFFGVPYVMETSPIEILENQFGREIVITFTTRNPSRHIYLDRIKHENPDTFDPTSNGHSIGKWEGETLVVDTIGFSAEGLTSIPGGGRRTPNSHLTERFHLINGGSMLSVISTWQDEQVFAKPQTYEFRYYRAPKNLVMPEYDCDTSNESRGKFLLEPPGTQVK